MNWIKKLAAFLEGGRNSAILIGVLSGVFIMLLSLTGFYEKLMYTLNDVRFSLASPVEDYDNLTIIEIEDNSIHQLGEYPLPRRYYATALEVMQGQGVEGVTFDIEFPDNSPSTINKDYLNLIQSTGKNLKYSKEEILKDLVLNNDAILAASLGKSPNTILPFSYQSFKTRVGGKKEDLSSFIRSASIPVKKEDLPRFSSLEFEKDFDKMAAPNASFRKNIDQFGFVNTRYDSDGTVRRMTLIRLLDDRLYFHLSVVMLAEVTDTPLEKIEVIPGKYIRLPNAANPVTGKIENLDIPINERGEVIINWAGGYLDAFHHLPFIALLEYNGFRDPVHSSLEDLAQSQPENKYTQLRQERAFLIEIYLQEKDKKERLATRLKLDEVNKKYLDSMDKLAAIVRDQMKSQPKESEDYQNNANFLDAFRIVREVETLANNLTVIGLTATGTQDIGVTPTSAEFWMVGVYHNLVNMFLQGKYIHLMPVWLHYFLVFVLSIALAVWINLLSAKRSLLAIAAGVFLVNVMAFGLFALFRLGTDQLGFNLAVLVPSLTITGIKFLKEESQKRFIKSAFSQYLSPDVIENIVDNPSLLQLGGETREITSFFSDVAGFSTISEKLTAQQLTSLLNEYLTEMTNIVLENKGTVDKYEGDAIISFFGAPMSLENHAYSCCLTAVQMQKRLEVLREKWRSEGRDELYVRIGMNSGNAMVGNMGSTMRMDYTAMGDTINLASRLEGANKYYKTYTMISSRTYEMIKDAFEVRELDKIRVVGKNEPITVYELLDLKGQLPEDKKRIIDLYHEGLALFRQKEWKKAEVKFKEALKIDKADGPSTIFAERCKEFQKTPPGANWDGVYKLGGK